MILEPRAADLDPVDVENALLRAALGDYSDEAAILLLITSGHWLPQLQHRGLITLDGNVDGEGLWAHIAWADLDGALRIGTIIGSSSQRWVLLAAAGWSWDSSSRTVRCPAEQRSHRRRRFPGRRSTATGGASRRRGAS
ncbi:hypothetical protein ABC795_04050 [Blastococcus sp. HT6-30]|uniref:hypothetical protein n=1 Tax=Blastococcus sp. HT6-30 TaxID=3144843 RepID=UPI00321BF67F